MTAMAALRSMDLTVKNHYFWEVKKRLGIGNTRGCQIRQTARAVKK
jgi:hypothetical protein